MKFQFSILLIFSTAIFATLSQIFLKRISSSIQIPANQTLSAWITHIMKEIIFTSDFLMCGIFSALAFIFSLLALRKYELTYYSPIVTGSFFLLVNLISFYLLRERITLAKVAGSSLILLGIFILNTSR